MVIYVGNLASAVSARELRTLFEAFGEVSSAEVIKDRVTGRSRGFGFVEMPAKQAAQQAIAELDNQVTHGTIMHVVEA